MKRVLTLGPVLGLLMTMQAPAFAGPVANNPTGMCQPTSTTPDVKETRRVQAVLVVGDTVYMGGRFDRVLPPGGGSPVTRNHLVACSLSTGAILPWNPDAAGAEPLKGSVFALATDGSRIIAGGAFDSIGGMQAYGLAALDPNPNNASPTPQQWGGNQAPGTFHKAEVKALAFSEDKQTLYMGGTFLSAGPAGNLNPHVGVAQINAATGAVSPWAPKLITETLAHCPVDDPTCIEEPPREIEVRGIVVKGNRVVVGGFFTEQSVKDSLGASYDGEGHVAAFDSVTGDSVGWEFKPKYPVYGLSADTERVYIAGAGKGVSKNAITAARWNDGNEEWTRNADGNWQAIWYQDGVVYGGGHMRRCGTRKQVREQEEPLVQRMCAFDPATGDLLDFAPTTETVGELGVFGIHGQGQSIVVVGEFTKVNGANQRGAVRFGTALTGGTPITPGTPGTPITPGNPGLNGGGYWMVATDGGIFSYGNAKFFGSTGNIRLNQPIVGMAATPSKQGYWLVASDGGIFAYGDAKFFGSAGNIKLAKPIVGMTTTPSGSGYWMVASDGGIFAFGDAKFFGSTGNIKLAQPIVGMTTSPGGSGYWMVASDGGIFAFGDAGFKGSTGNIKLAKPITAMTATTSGQGYWMTATDGGIFAFGDAQFKGSTGGQALAKPIVAMSTSPTGGGYLLAGANGAVFAFGDAIKFGNDLSGTPLAKPIVGLTGF
jgi:hypothetical protein